MSGLCEFFSPTAYPAEETLADRGAMLARGLGRTRRAGTRALSSLPETPPLPLFGIGGRYATAIYTAAAKKGELEKVDTDLKVTAARAESGVRVAEDARARLALCSRSAARARRAACGSSPALTAPVCMLCTSGLLRGARGNAGADGLHREPHGAARREGRHARRVRTTPPPTPTTRPVATLRTHTPVPVGPLH